MGAGRRRQGSVSWQAVLDIGQKKQNLLKDDWVRLKCKGYNAVTLSTCRACFLCESVIKPLTAIITIVLFLRAPQRMMQENSLIFASSASKFSGLWASKGIGSYWVKSSLARQKMCWHIADLQETLGTFSGKKSMAKPLPPTFHSRCTWGTCKVDLTPKSLLMQSLVSTGKHNLVFLRKEMVGLSVYIYWYKYVLLQKFTSAMTLLQGSYALVCTIILFYGTYCKWICGSFKLIH